MMQGFTHTWRRIFFKIIVICGLLLLAPASFAKIETVLIIKSSDNNFFNRTIERLTNQSHPQIKFIIKTLDSVKEEGRAVKQPDLIITLGIAAANYSIKNHQHSPVIHSYITEYQYLKHDKNVHRNNHYSILLDQPLHRYLNFIKQLATFNKVGIISNINNFITDDMVQQYKSSLNMEIGQEMFKQGDNPLNKVKDLLHYNDVLLSLPNPEVYNRQTLKGILLTTYRQNKPVISYSPAHVKSGALAAIFSSPDNIGKQIASLLNKIVSDGSFKPRKYYYASEFDISINHRVGKSLGLNLSDQQQIMKKLKSDKFNDIR